MLSAGKTTFARRPSRGRAQPRYPQKDAARASQVRQARPPHVNVSAISTSNGSYLNSTAELRSPVIDFAAARVKSEAQKNKGDHSRRGSTPGTRFHLRESKEKVAPGRKMSSIQIHKSQSSPLIYRSHGAPYATSYHRPHDGNRAANAVTSNRVNGSFAAAYSQFSNFRPDWNSSTKGPVWSFRTKLESGARKGIPIKGFTKDNPIHRGPLRDNGIGPTHTPKEHSANQQASVYMPKERLSSGSRKVTAFSSKPHNQSLRLAPHRLDETFLPKSECSFKRKEVVPKRRAQGPRSPRRPHPNYPSASKHGESLESSPGDAQARCSQIWADSDYLPESVQIYRQLLETIICRDDKYGHILAQIRDAYDAAFRKKSHLLPATQNVKTNQEMRDELCWMKTRFLKGQEEHSVVSRRLQETEEAIQADRCEIHEALDTLTAPVTSASVPVRQAQDAEKRDYANGNAYADANYPSQRMVCVLPPAEDPIKKSQAIVTEFEALEFESLPRPTPRTMKRPDFIPPLRLGDMRRRTTICDTGSVVSYDSEDTVRVSELMASASESSDFESD